MLGTLIWLDTLCVHFQKSCGILLQKGAEEDGVQKSGWRGPQLYDPFVVVVDLCASTSVLCRI